MVSVGSWIDRYSRAGFTAYVSQSQTPLGDPILANRPNYGAGYRRLRDYYDNNALYDATAQYLYQLRIWTPGMKGLRNPCFRTTEFYVSHVWPGKIGATCLQIETDVPDAIAKPIAQVWRWSGLQAQKQVWMRWNAIYGDLFVKVRTSPALDRVYYENILPELVTDFEVDDRQNLIWIRIDVPMSETVGNTTRSWVYTEIWSKADQDVKIYRTERPTWREDQLGEPVQRTTFAEMGVDFVPIAHTMFRDVGDDRGVGAFTGQIEKIDELNAAVTRLHQLSFRYNKPLFAILSKTVDELNRPMPGPRPTRTDGTSVAPADPVGPTDPYYMGDEDVQLYPGDSEPKFMVPDINFAAQLQICAATMGELREDLPETIWFKPEDLRSDLSGRAIRFMLGPAITRAEEVRGNLEAALIRLDMMALTVGKNVGLFREIPGTYESGAFEHDFVEKEIMPLSPLERQEEKQAGANAGLALTELGVSKRTILTDLGYDYDDEAERREEEGTDLADTVLTGFERGDQFGSGRGA